MGLDTDGGLLRVQAGGKVIESHIHDVLPDFARIIGIICQSLVVGDEDIDGVELA